MTDKPTVKPDDLLTIPEIAAIVGLSPKSTRTYHESATRRRREGQPTKPTQMPAPDAKYSRSVLWRRSTILAWVAAREERVRRVEENKAARRAR